MRAAVAFCGRGAVVDTVRLITEFPLPEPTCAGLNAQVVSAGRAEQERLRLFGNVPVVGFTSRLNRVEWPATTDAPVGVGITVKSKL